MWFDKNELKAFPRAKKLASPNIDENLALAKIRLDAELENEQGSAEIIIDLAIDILFLVIRLFL